MRRVLTWISGPLLAALFLWLAFHGTDLATLSGRIKQASVPLLLMAMGMVALHMLSRALRWRTFLAPISRTIPFRELLSATTIGNMASLLPGRVSEVLRPALLTRRTRIPFLPALATVGVERVVFDLLGILVLGGVGLLVPARLSGLDRVKDPRLLESLHAIGGIALLVAFGLFIGATWVARRQQQVGDWLIRRQHRGASRVTLFLLEKLERLLPGLGALGTTRGIVRLSLETLLVWIVITCGIHAGVTACGVELAPASALVMLPILAAGIGIPTPGGAGSYHFAMIQGLTRLFDAPIDAAQSAALVVHASSYLPLLLMGGAFCIGGGLTSIDRADQAAQ